MARVFLLIVATSFWGLGFVGTRWTFISYDPLTSHGLRYIIAGLIALFLLFFRKKGLHFKKETLICGILLWMALLLQTIGIQQTSLAKSGFLTTFYAIITPILGMIFWGHRYKKTYWPLVALALMGMAFLCGLKLSGLNRGDLYIIASALFFSLHIFAVDSMAKEMDSLTFNFQQCVVMGILGFASSAFVSGLPSLSPLLGPFTHSQMPFFPSVFGGFFILSILSSLVAFSIQIHAQKGIPAHIVSLIFLLESIFSALFGFLFFNEKLDQMGLIGAGLIILSLALIPHFGQEKKKAPSKEREGRKQERRKLLARSKIKNSFS